MQVGLETVSPFPTIRGTMPPTHSLRSRDAEARVLKNVFRVTLGGIMGIITLTLLAEIDGTMLE